MHRRPGGSSGIHSTFLLLCHAGCFIRGDIGFAKTQVLRLFRCLVCILLQFLLLGLDCSTLDFFGGERVAMRSLSSSNFSLGCFSLMLLRLRNFGKAGRKDAVEFKVFREVVNKGQDRVTEKQQPLTFAGVGHIGKLMG